MSDRPSPAALLTSFLADSSARCPACRYALRGGTSDKCPECGCQITLGVVAATSRATAWWVASIFGCCVSIFIAATLLVMLLLQVAAALENPGIMQMARSGFAPMNDLPHWSALFTLVIFALLAGAMLGWLIARRHAFANWPAPRRVIIGVLSWLSPLIVLGLVDALIHS